MRLCSIWRDSKPRFPIRASQRHARPKTRVAGTRPWKFSDTERFRRGDVPVLPGWIRTILHFRYRLAKHSRGFRRQQAVSTNFQKISGKNCGGQGCGRVRIAPAMAPRAAPPFLGERRALAAFARYRQAAKSSCSPERQHLRTRPPCIRQVRPLLQKLPALLQLLGVVVCAPHLVALRMGEPSSISS